jgi:hypothetical protein
VIISKSPSAEQDFVSVDRELCDSQHCYTINLDVERARPRGNVQKDARWGLRGKVSRINFIELREVRLISSAIYIALHDVLQRRAGGLDASLHLLKHDFGLSFERQTPYLAGFRIEWRQA